MLRSLLVVPLLVVGPTALTAQSTRVPPSGAHNYQVTATYEGQPMMPWMSQAVIGDTVLDGEPALSVTYNSREDGEGWRFVYRSAVALTDLWSPRATWDGNGRAGPAHCIADVADGVVRIADAYGERSSAHDGVLIPDFTLVPVLSTLPLAHDRTFELTVYRCNADPTQAATVRVWSIVATVTTGVHARQNGQPEPVWIVRTTGGFDIEAIIAQADRLAIEVTTDQSGMGTMTERYVGTE